MKQSKKADPPVCWTCDRKLSNAFHYVIKKDEQGIERPHHVLCQSITIEQEAKELVE